MSPRFALLVLPCAWLAAAAPARADAVAEARAAFQAGRRHYEARDHAAALAQFERSLEHVASPNTQLYVARCLTELGRDAEAAVAYRETLLLVERAGGDAGEYAEAGRAARQELGLLRLRLATVRVLGLPDGVRVTLDERSVPASALEAGVELEPGATELRIEAPGFAPHREPLALRPGQELVLRPELRPAPRPRAGHDTAAAPARELIDLSAPAPVAARPPVAAWIAAGVGAAALASFALFAAQARATRARVESGCTPAPCPDALRAQVRAGRRQERLANLSLAAAGAALFTGGVLWWIGVAPDREGTPARALIVGLGGAL